MGKDWGELAGVNPECTFCHGEGFRRVPDFEVSKGKWVYARVGCAACFTERLKLLVEGMNEVAPQR